MSDPATPLDRQLAAADEYDRRQAAGPDWVEEDLDPETLARYEDERAAWEAAGGDIVDTWGRNLTAPAPGQAPRGRRIDHLKTAWDEQLETDYINAEDATRGYLIRKDRLEEFRARYGTDTTVLFQGPARVAYYYASRELRDHWDTLPRGRETFAEFALRNGVTDKKTRDRARAAAEARDDARNRADESTAGREKRKRQREEARRRRLPKTAGERLAAEQARRDRIRAAERRADTERRRLEEDE